MSKVIRKKRKIGNSSKTQTFVQARDSSYAQGEQSNQNNQYNQIKQKHIAEKDVKPQESGSQNKLKGTDQQTVGAQSVDQAQPRPYQFLKYANPPLHTIFVPHFTVRSITFGLSVIFVICFIVLLIYSYTKPIQNKLTWNCSIFQLQNKYYPRIRYSYQFWRVPVSFFFHSNIPHFALNIIGFQIYGYFVQWYYGKIKYVVVLILSGIMAHFLSCVAQPVTVSTVPSTFLFAVLLMKLYFLWDYRDYKPLLTRRIFIYVLLALILGINLIPIFVNNNVDFTTHIAGAITGGLLGLFFHIQKQQSPSKSKIFVKFLSVGLIGLIIVLCIALMYALPDTNSHYWALNENIARKCSSPLEQ